MGSGGGNNEPAPTAQERQLSRTGAEQWNDFDTRWKPQNDEFIRRSKTTDGERDQVAGAVGADAVAARQGSENASARTALSTGRSMATAFARDASRSSGSVGAAQGQAAQAADNNELAVNVKLGAFGRGLSDNSLVSLNRAGNAATQKTISDAKNDFAERQAWREAIGAGVGMYAKTNGLFTPKSEGDMRRTAFKARGQQPQAWGPDS